MRSLRTEVLMRVDRIIVYGFAVVVVCLGLAGLVFLEVKTDIIKPAPVPSCMSLEDVLEDVLALDGDPRYADCVCYGTPDYLELK